jgi:SAM-dependent methyltransferase
MSEPVFETIDRCRGCGAEGLHTFLDLGQVPLADALVPESRRAIEEARYPLTVAFCASCSLVQIRETVPATTLFGEEYPYYSSFSPYLVEHSRRNVEAIVDDRKLGPDHLAVELASNDGYLLQWFQKAGVKVLGIDPAPGPAQAAIEKGIPTLVEFFDDDMAGRLRLEGVVADVIIGNNVLAHVPNQNRFVAGIARLLADDGIAVHEFPYVRDLVDHVEFDTIYHEHACYFSVHAVRDLYRRHGLPLIKVEHLPIHGGSLRVTFGRSSAPDPSVEEYLSEERRIGLTDFAYYEAFAGRVKNVKAELRALLDDLKSEGASIAAYGAAAKGTTLLNYTGVGANYLEYVVDRNVHKQNWYMPGVDLPIHDPTMLLKDRPDYTLILAWNFKDEIIAQQQEYVDAGGRFVIPIPHPTVQ